MRYSNPNLKNFIESLFFNVRTTILIDFALFELKLVLNVPLN